jgi:uncharacterized protein (TIGR03089 family)
MPPSTLASLLSHSADPSRPFVTYYDLASGERTELSVRTLDNWVAKTANLITEELDSPARIRLGVPSHWLRVVWLLSAWSVGAAVVDRRADAAFCGPDLAATEPLRVASALRPFGLPFAEAPTGFLDFGVEAAAQPDVFVALDPPGPGDLALDLAGDEATHAELLARCQPDDGRRLVRPGELGRDAGLVIAAALGGGSLVLVAHADGPEGIQRVADQERVDPRWIGPLHSPE